MKSQTVRHRETDECTLWHCSSHEVDEVHVDPFRVCGECHHSYRSAGALRRAHRRMEWQMYRAPWLTEKSLWYTLWSMLTARASKIHFCQECTHDF